jgi:hypothetical protein
MTRKLALAFFGVLFAFDVSSFTQERPRSITLVSTIADASAGVSAYGNLMFVGQRPNALGGGSVAIFDISNPAGPVRLGETPRYPATGADESRAVRIGHRVVLAVSLMGAGTNSPTSPRGLKLFDISHAARPTELGFYDPGPGLLGGSFSGAIHFDIAASPKGKTLALLSTPGTEVRTSNFGAGPGLGDLQIVDISDPTRPSLIGEWGVLDEPKLGLAFFLREQRGARADAFAESVHASRDGKRVYLAYSDHGGMILDISDPSQPLLLGHIGFEAGNEGNAFDVRPARGGNLLLRSHLVRFTFQIQLSSNVYSDQRTAGESGNTPAIYNRPGHAIDGEVVFVGAGCPQDPYLADPNGRIAIMLTAGCTANQKIARAQLAGAVAVIFYDDGPLAGFDAQFAPGGGGTVVTPDGTTVTVDIPAIGVGQNTGRCLAQVRAQSGALRAVGCSTELPVTVNATAFFQGFGRLEIFDIRDPADPIKLSTFATPNSIDLNGALTNRFPNPPIFFSANYLDVRGHLAFIGWERDGLRIVDISRPAAPREIAVWNGEGRPSGAPPVHGWQVVRHRNLILFSSLFEGAVYILQTEDSPGSAADVDEPR